MRVCLLQRITLKVEEGGSGGPVYIAVAAQDRYSPNMKFCPNRPNYHYQKLTEIPTRQNLSSNRLKTENKICSLILEPLVFNLLRLRSVVTIENLFLLLWQHLHRKIENQHLYHDIHYSVLEIWESYQMWRRYILPRRYQPLQQPQHSYHLLLQVLQGYRGGMIYSYDGINHSSNHNTATIYYSR